MTTPSHPPAPHENDAQATIDALRFTIERAVKAFGDDRTPWEGDIADRITALRAQLADAAADTDLLDWLEANMDVLVIQDVTPTTFRLEYFNASRQRRYKEGPVIRTIVSEVMRAEGKEAP